MRKLLDFSGCLLYSPQCEQSTEKGLKQFCFKQSGSKGKSSLRNCLMIISQRLGQATASKIVFQTVKEGKGAEKLSSVYDVYKDFKLLMELDLVQR